MDWAPLASWRARAGRRGRPPAVARPRGGPRWLAPSRVPSRPGHAPPPGAATTAAPRWETSTLDDHATTTITMGDPAASAGILRGLCLGELARSRAVGDLAVLDLCHRGCTRRRLESLAAPRPSVPGRRRPDEGVLSEGALRIVEIDRAPGPLAASSPAPSGAGRLRRAVSAAINKARTRLSAPTFPATPSTSPSCAAAPPRR